MCLPNLSATVLILLFICLLLDRTCYTLLVGLDLSSFSASAYNVLFTGHVSLVNEQWSLLKSAEYAAKSLSLKIEAQRSSPSALDKVSRPCVKILSSSTITLSTMTKSEGHLKIWGCLIHLPVHWDWGEISKAMARSGHQWWCRDLIEIWWWEETEWGRECFLANRENKDGRGWHEGDNNEMWRSDGGDKWP